MKNLNFKNKIFLSIAVIASLIFSTSITYARTINFSGYDWDVKEGQGGPGPNNWGNTEQDVFVDGESRLHMKVSKHDDDLWYSSEVFLKNSLGYGKYSFDFDSHVDTLDENLIAAPFLYQDDDHEIDIEYSYWSLPGSSNLHYTIQPPPYTEENHYNKNFVLENGSSSHIIDWQPNKISFSTIQNNNILDSWTYSGEKNFVPGSELVHINFWQNKGLIPANATSSELIVGNFIFEPYVPPATKATSTPIVNNVIVTTSSVELFWDPVVDATTYEVSSTASTTFSTSNSSVIFNDLTPNFEYSFQVREFNGTDYSDFSTVVTTSTPALSVNDEEYNIRVRIVAYDSSVFDQTIKVKKCEKVPNSNVYTINAWCAIKQAEIDGNLTVGNSWGEYGVFLTNINQYDGLDGKWWLWFAEGGGLNPGQTSLNEHVLQDGEAILLTYGISPLRTTMKLDGPYLIYSTSTILAQYFDESIWDWKLATDVIFDVAHFEQLTTIPSPSGELDIYSDSTDTLFISAKKDGFVTSDSIGFETNLPKTSINLDVFYTKNLVGSSYANLDVSACKENEETQKYTLNAMCAINKTGLTTNWSTWGTDMFLNSIEGYQNNQNENGVYWNWFVQKNNEMSYGQTALNKHILTADEKIILTYDTFPLRISMDSYTPEIGTTTTITIEEFGFDSLFNSVWKNASSSSVIINNTFETETDDGKLSLFITSTDPIYIKASKTNFVTTVLLINPTSTASNTTTQNNNTNNNGTGGSGGSQIHNKIDVNKAVEFLSNNKNSNGSFGSSDLYTDWVAIALSTQNNDNVAKLKIKEYLLSNPDIVIGLNEVGSLARRSMALMSLGISPYDGTKTNYIQKIVDSFGGNQFGDNNLYNDDIFALLTLLKSGYQTTEPMIIKDIKYILSKQNPNGSWDGVDLTAAAIQALGQAKNVEGVDEALTKSLEYLQTSLNNEGGFGNVESTAWAIQAIDSSTDSASNWLKNNLNPHDYLYKKQSASGSVTTLPKEENNLDSKIWSTAYSIPAGLDKNWNEILTSFSKPLSPATTTTTNTEQNTGGTTNTTTSTANANIPTSTTPTTASTIQNKETAISISTLNSPVVKENPNPQIPKNVVTPIIVRNIKPTTSSQTIQKLTSGQSPINKNDVIDSLPLDTPTKRTAKKVLAISGGSALLVAGYLGLRLLRNVV